MQPHLFIFVPIRYVATSQFPVFLGNNGHSDPGPRRGSNGPQLGPWPWRNFSSTWQPCSFSKDKLPFGNEILIFSTIIQIKPNNIALEGAPSFPKLLLPFRPF